MVNRVYFLFLLALFLSSCSQFGAKNKNDTNFVGHLTVQEANLTVPDKLLAQLNSSENLLIPNPNLFQLENKYSLSAFEVSINRLLFELATVAGYQIDIWPDVEGLVTLNAVSQSLEVILERIANQLNLDVEVQDRLISVKKSVPLWQTYLVDYVNIKRSAEDTIVMNMTVGGSVNAASQAVGSKSEIKISSSHDFWNSLNRSLLSLLGEQIITGEAETSNNTSLSSNLIINSEAGLVLVRAGRKTQLEVKKFLSQLVARSEKQVMIEASVVEVELSDEYQSGIDWSNDGFKNISNRNLILAQPESVPISENVFTAKVNNKVGLDLSLGLKMLETFGSVKVLSSPKIMAVNNQSALLKVVDNQVYFTIDVSRSTSTAGTDVTYSTTVHSVPVGFMMSVTPFVNEKREVSLNVRPTISRIIGYVADPNPDLKAEMVESLVPIVQEREMETVLKLRDMQTAVIGGLIEDRKTAGSSGITGLSRIPFIGKLLFGYEGEAIKKTELVIFIRPVIVENPDIQTGDLQHYYALLKHRSNEFNHVK